MPSNYQSEKRRVHRFLALQNSTIDYYKKAAYITTDEGLKRVLNSIISQHLDMRVKVESVLNKRYNTSNNFREVKGLLERIHRKFYIALVVNTQKKVLEYVWQSECKMLQEIIPIMELFSKDTRAIALLQQYKHEINDNLINIETHIIHLRHNRIVF